MKRRMLALGLLLAMGMAVAVVGGEGSGIAAADLVGKGFVLDQVDGKDFRADPQPILEFGDNLAVHGKICNGFRGAATLADGVLRFEHVISTRMLCLHNDLSLLETHFLRLMEKGMEVSLTNGVLTLRNEDGQLAFRQQSDHDDDSLPAMLAGRKFVLKKVAGEDFAVDRQPFIEFDEDLRVNGRACNNFIGPGRLDGDVLTVENAASTMMMCVDPKLNAYEGALHQLLRDGAKIILSGKSLTLGGENVEFVYEEE